MHESDPNSPERPHRGLEAWIVFAVAVATWTVSLGNGYAMDDVPVAKADYGGGSINPYVADLLSIREYFESHYWAATVESDRLYRPVTILSFALRQAIFGESAFVDHAINVLLHGVASVCVFFLALRAIASVRGAFFAGLAFAAMGVHAEVVAGVVGRAELFAFSFGALALLVLPRERPAAVWRIPLGIVLLFLAFCSKESAIAWAPFALIFAWFTCRERKRTLVEVAISVGIPLVLWAVLRERMIDLLPGVPEPAPFASNPLYGASFLERLHGGILAMGLGLLSTIAPFWLASDWGAMLFAPQSLSTVWAIVATIVLSAWFVQGVALMRRRPGWFLAMAAFFGFAFPLSNILVPIGVSYAERLYYAPSFGVALLIAMLVSAAPRAKWPCIAFFVLQAVIGVLRAPQWKDDTTIRLTDVRRQPSSVNLRLYAANTLMLRRTEVDSRKALEHIRAAIELDGQSAVAWAAMAALQSGAGAFKEAIGSLELALRAEHLAGHHVEDRLWVNLGNLRHAQGDADKAVDAWARALAASRYCVDAFVALRARRDEGAIDSATLDRLIESAASRDAGPRMLEIWDTYRVLAKPIQDDGRATLRRVREALPRGVFADPLRRLIDAAM
ncbi:MAG: hypothetical protein H6832_15255 [Planctomycetes bacterium]|nr:hypothetical protein [Planctomycetota bacterium]MCB9892678.1 hypothetical protein [Planctomycetota bacterium]MCB9919758.1 hypothetical protein [Planctomycetota bacterium]